jgi:hypothetical protein
MLLCVESLARFSNRCKLELKARLPAGVFSRFVVKPLANKRLCRVGTSRLPNALPTFVRISVGR